MSLLPLCVHKTTEHPHKVCGCPDIGFVIEFIHEFGLGLHFWVGDRVTPIVYHYQDEGA